MKKYTLFAVFLILSIAVFAQQNNAVTKDDHFKFNTRITDAENKWVVFPPAANSDKYPYGFIYVDQQAGFTFDLQGFLLVNSNGEFSIDTAFQKKHTGLVKYRLDGNAKNVAVINPQHFAELSIKAEPDWLKTYKTVYIDDAAHNFRLGFIYNGAGDSEKALAYLNKADKEDANYKGLAFEMTYAYNALKRFPEAEKTAASAIKSDKTNLLLYRELGYAYLGESNLPKAIESMTTGLDNCPNANNNDKAEVAFNISKAYNFSGNTVEYKNWATKAKQWANPNTPLYRALVSMGF